VWAPDGTFTTVVVPGAMLAKGGTEPSGINTAGAITEFFSDAKGVFHGFLRTP
jgi:hypothetical protein